MLDLKKLSFISKGSFFIYSGVALFHILSVFLVLNLRFLKRVSSLDLHPQLLI
jgi:hypothetical protein